MMRAGGYRSRGTVPIFAAEKAFRLHNALFAARMGLSPSAGDYAVALEGAGAGGWAAGM